MTMIEQLKQAATKGLPRWSLNGVVGCGIAVSNYDGDTCDVVMTTPGEGEGIKRFTIRMLGYNSPEMKSKSSWSDDERMRNHNESIKAKNELWNLLGGEYKALLRIECSHFDVFGRILARVYRLSHEDSIDKVDFCVNDRMLLLPSSIPYTKER